MPYDDIYLQADEDMGKSVEYLRQALRSVRSARATPALLENVKVDYYGAATPLQQLAAVAAPSANLLVIRPYDPSALGNIERGILQADLGFTPNNDGKLIRIVVPVLSDERRKKLIAHVKELAENAKRTVRAARHEALKVGEKEKKDGGLPEDDFFRLKDDIQELTDDHERKVDELVEKKTAEIMQE